MTSKNGYSLGASLSSSELDKIAEAYKSVSRIKEIFHYELNNVSDPEKTQHLLEQASREMMEAIKAQGLDFEKYSQTMEAVNTDEKLRQSLLLRLKK